jgi:hypothetical protein
MADDMHHPHTIPVISKIQSHVTPAQANCGANRAITNDVSLLHNSHQLDKLFPVGSINVDNKIYCTVITKIHLLMAEDNIKQFPCFCCNVNNLPAP